MMNKLQRDMYGTPKLSIGGSITPDFLTMEITRYSTHTKSGLGAIIMDVKQNSSEFLAEALLKFEKVEDVDILIKHLYELKFMMIDEKGEIK